MCNHGSVWNNPPCSFHLVDYFTYWMCWLSLFELMLRIMRMFSKHVIIIIIIVIIINIIIIINNNNIIIIMTMLFIFSVMNDQLLWFGCSACTLFNMNISYFDLINCCFGVATFVRTESLHVYVSVAFGHKLIFKNKRSFYNATNQSEHLIQMTLLVWEMIIFMI